MKGKTMSHKILYIGYNTYRMPTEGRFIDSLNELGEVNLIYDGSQMTNAELAELIRQYDVLLLHWDSIPVPDEIALSPGNLKYICSIVGSVKRYVSLNIIDSKIIVSNWGNIPTRQVAEGALTLLLSVLKDLHAQIQEVRAQGWRLPSNYVGGSVEGLNLGIYGLGVIGEEFIRLIAPLNPVIRIYDPYVKKLPENCLRAESLSELFSNSQAVVIHAGLNEETKKSVTADLLAMLPDNGIIINTARGDIIDQDALFVELQSGRLRAGLDVLAEPDILPQNHLAREWNNCIFSAHTISDNWVKSSRVCYKMEQLCIENIGRFLRNEPVQNIITRNKYLLSS